MTPPHHLPALMRRSGMLGILGVVVFVVGLAMGSGTIMATDVTLTDLNIPGLNEPDTSGILFKLASLLAYGIAPALFLLVFQTYQAWMAAQMVPLGGWFYHLGMLGIFFWLLGGGIMVLIMPAVTILKHPNAVTLAAGTQIAYGGLIDIAYLFVSIYLVLVGWFLHRRMRYTFLGSMAILSSGTVIPIILMGPYTTVNFFGIYATGAPVVGIFAVATALLQEAEHLVQEASRGS